MPSTLRELRERRGFTQAGLAARAGISRQAVTAIEAGRHLPRVDAALALAAALGVDVAQLFSPAPGEGDLPCVSVLGGVPAEGAAVFAAPVGDRLVCLPVELDARRGRAWPAPDGTIDGGGLRLLPGAEPDGVVAVGCDPALGLLAALLPPAGRSRLLAASASSAAAAEALRDGRAHVGLVHGRPEDLERHPAAAGVVRVELARWRVGLALATRHPAAVTLDELVDSAEPVVQREPGAASQEALVRALAALGLELPPGPLAPDHLEAARLVAAGAAAGVTMEPAALALGLAFLPLEEHVAELRVGTAWAGEPGVQELLELTGAAAFRARARLVAGYDVTRAGTVRA
jgi:transcriptional regulator with XRE-family HTH domain/molybdate-binding protein